MPHNRRQHDRVHFEFGYDARIMAIDATWQRACIIADISQSGARLVVQGSIADLATTELSLVLSHIGGAHRRCKIAWINGDEVGVSFLHELPAAKDRFGRRQFAEDPKSG